jgi:hypothetical protein
VTTSRAYTVATLAAEWDCSEGVIRKLVAAGDLRCFRLGTLIRIAAEEARRFECQNTPSSGLEADSQSSIGTPLESATGSDFRRPTVLGRRRKLGGDGPQGATVHHGPWA